MSIWLNLIWKEWHEQKWRLVSLTAIAVSVCVTMLIQVYGSVDFALAATTFVFTLSAPVFVGMGISAGEQATGVIRFVRAQPVPLWKIGTVRWLMGLLVLLFPLFCVGLVCVFANWLGTKSELDSMRLQLFPTWNHTASILAMAAAGMAACLNSYAWIVAFAVNQPGEYRAGLIGVLTIVVVFVAGIVGLSGWDNYLPSISVINLMALISGPLICAGMFDFVQNHNSDLVPIAIVWQLILNVGLFVMMVVRYGRKERWMTAAFLNRNPAASGKVKSLHAPISSQWRALLWLQMRQSIPVCVASLAITAALGIAGLAFAPVGFDSLFPIIGCVLALLIGVGGFVPELQPALHTFWRSRPISPSSWFWFKFIGGAVALVAVFDLPCVLLASSGMVYTSSRGMGALFPALLHLLCYSIAVLAACCVRHSTYSMVFAVGGLMIILLPEMTAIQVPHFLAFFSMWNHAARTPQATFLTHLLPCCIFVSALALPAALVAAYLVKRDISIAS